MSSQINVPTQRSWADSAHLQIHLVMCSDHSCVVNIHMHDCTASCRQHLASANPHLDVQQHVTLLCSAPLAMHDLPFNCSAPLAMHNLSFNCTSSLVPSPGQRPFPRPSRTRLSRLHRPSAPCNTWGNRWCLWPQPLPHPTYQLQVSACHPHFCHCD